MSLQSLDWPHTISLVVAAILLPVSELFCHMSEVSDLVKEEKEQEAAQVVLSLRRRLVTGALSMLRARMWPPLPMQRRLASGWALWRFIISTSLGGATAIAIAIIEGDSGNIVSVYVGGLALFIVAVECWVAYHNWGRRARYASLLIEGKNKTAHAVRNFTVVYVALEATFRVVPVNLPPVMPAHAFTQHVRLENESCPLKTDAAHGGAARHVRVVKAERATDGLDVIWTCEP